VDKEAGLVVGRGRKREPAAVLNGDVERPCTARVFVEEFCHLFNRKVLPLVRFSQLLKIVWQQLMLRDENKIVNRYQQVIMKNMFNRYTGQ
jgi:hypothetical protein